MKRKLATETQHEGAVKRILIVDDHPFLRMGVREALAKEPGLMICDDVGTAEAALESAVKNRADLVVSDLNLPGKNGIELIKDLAKLRPELPVIILSMHDEDVYAERCLRAGARGYVMKGEGPDKLAAAIRQVLAGSVFVSTKVAGRLVDHFSGRQGEESRDPVHLLTDRELEIFECLGRGLSTEDVAARLHISPKTVETHRVHIKAKLGFASTSELIAYAARWMAAPQ